MPTNCPQIKEQYTKILELKNKFDELFDLGKLEEAYEVKKELKKLLENVEELVEIRLVAVVDYSRPIEELLEAGNYDFAHNDYINNEIFPPENKSKSKVRFKIIDVPYNMSRSKNTSFEQFAVQLDKRGLRPATLQELLAFRERYSKKKDKNARERFNFLVATGSIAVVKGGQWDPADINIVPCIHGGDLFVQPGVVWFQDGSVNGGGMGLPERINYTNFRFLAVYK